MRRVGDILAERLSLLGDLGDAEREALGMLEGEVRTVRRHGDILRKHDRPTHSVVVISGLLLRYTLGVEGRRQIHSFYFPSDAPSLETLYIDYVDTSLGAVVDSEVGLIPHEQLYRLIDERPRIRALIWRETLIQGAIFRGWLMRNSIMPAHGSTAHFFCEMFTRAKAAGLADGNSFALPITQEILSDALGLTAVHTNRTMMLLRDAGAVEWKSGRVTVKDWDKLSQIGEFDPDYLHLKSG